MPFVKKEHTEQKTSGFRPRSDDAQTTEPSFFESMKTAVEGLSAPVREMMPDIDYSKVKGAGADRKSTRLNSSHVSESRMPSSA